MSNQKRPTVSLVMLSWARPDNVRRIADRQCQYEVIDEFIVLNNNPNVHLRSSQSKVRALNCSHSFPLRSRWCAATLARSEVIVFQDDDLIVSERGLNHLVDMCTQETDRMCGIDGRIPDDNNQYNVRQHYGDVPIVLTRCVAFPNQLIPYVLKCEQEFERVFGPLPAKNGEDIFLSFAASSFFNAPNFAIPTAIQPLPDAHGISQRPGHVETRTEVLQNCQRFFGQV